MTGKQLTLRVCAFLTYWHKREVRREIVLLLVYWAGASLFKSIYVETTGEYTHSTLAALTDFQAARPFQYRILLPLLVHGWQKAFSIDLHQAYQILTVVSTFGLFIVFRLYLGLFLPKGFCWFGTLALLYPLFWNYCVLSTFFYASDIPAIFFFVVGLISLHQRKWGLFYGNFVLATFNRETSCFLIVALLVTMLGQQRLRSILAHLIALAAIWFAIKWSLTLAFSRNPGEPAFENHLQENLARLNALLHGDPHMVTAIGAAFGLVWLLIPLAWREQPVFFKRLLWVVVPFLLGMGVVGNIDEIRIYNELIPVLLAPALFSLSRLLDKSQAT